MSDRINFDTLDILAAAMGVMLAFSILPVPAERGTERTLVGLAVLTMVALKRFFIRTKKASPDSKAGMRLAYLFIALVGTIWAGLPLIAIFVDSMTEYREEGVIQSMLGSGITLFLIATYNDRRLLKLP